MNALQEGISGTVGATLAGGRLVASGVIGPLTITLPRYQSSFCARFWDASKW